MARVESVFVNNYNLVVLFFLEIIYKDNSKELFTILLSDRRKINKTRTQFLTSRHVSSIT